MKTKMLFVSLLMMTASCINAQTKPTAKEKKILVVYYSLRNGNTRVVAEQIQKSMGGDLFRIETVNTYPTEYNAVTEQAKKELESGYKPALKTTVKDIAQYDVIFIGSPCWWSTTAPAVRTFLSSYDLSGKTIVPFMTHEGSGMGHSEADIKKLCPKSSVLEGLPIRGSAVKESQNAVDMWLRKIKMVK